MHIMIRKETVMKTSKAGKTFALAAHVTATLQSAEKEVHLPFYVPR